jgi:hypothetical protein
MLSGLRHMQLALSLHAFCQGLLSQHACHSQNRVLQSPGPPAHHSNSAALTLTLALTLCTAHRYLRGLAGGSGTTTGGTLRGSTAEVSLQAAAQLAKLEASSLQQVGTQKPA